MENAIANYVRDLIVMFDSALYQTINEVDNSKLYSLCYNHQPYIHLLRDMHVQYYNTMYESLRVGDNNETTDNFIKLAKTIGHSKICVLSVIANLTPSVHFNLDRKSFSVNSHLEYVESLSREIMSTVFMVNLKELFNHRCTADTELLPLTGNYIDIDIDNKPKKID